MVLVFPFLLIIYDIFVFECTKNYLLIITFFTIIISDVMDGYLARKLKCVSNIGAKLDIISDALYTILSLAIFAYFNIIPLWFVFILILKLFEFVVTSKIINVKQKTNNSIFFDKIGKYSIIMVMLLPGLFVFRCIVIDYRR
jgi:CDP-diacylglycerol--glycerol-3-phosphate 3-phosphatidyltransferase